MINKAKVSVHLSFYTDLVNFMSIINHRTHVSCKKKVTKIILKFQKLCVTYVTVCKML